MITEEVLSYYFSYKNERKQPTRHIEDFMDFNCLNFKASKYFRENTIVIICATSLGEFKEYIVQNTCADEDKILYFQQGKYNFSNPNLVFAQEILPTHFPLFITMTDWRDKKDFQTWLYTSTKTFGGCILTPFVDAQPMLEELFNNNSSGEKKVKESKREINVLGMAGEKLKYIQDILSKGGFESNTEIIDNVNLIAKCYRDKGDWDVSSYREYIVSKFED